MTSIKVTGALLKYALEELCEIDWEGYETEDELTYCRDLNRLFRKYGVKSRVYITLIKEDKEDENKDVALEVPEAELEKYDYANITEWLKCLFRCKKANFSCVYLIPHRFDYDPNEMIPEDLLYEILYGKIRYMPENWEKEDIDRDMNRYNEVFVASGSSICIKCEPVEGYRELTWTIGSRYKIR